MRIKHTVQSCVVQTHYKKRKSMHNSFTSSHLLLRLLFGAGRGHEALGGHLLGLHGGLLLLRGLLLGTFLVITALLRVLGEREGEKMSTWVDSQQFHMNFRTVRKI